MCPCSMYVARRVPLQELPLRPLRLCQGAVLQEGSREKTFLYELELFDVAESPQQ